MGMEPGAGGDMERLRMAVTYGRMRSIWRGMISGEHLPAILTGKGFGRRWRLPWERRVRPCDM